MYAKRTWNTSYHFKEKVISHAEFSELFQVAAVIVRKHKYFPLIKKASSRCILPQCPPPSLQCTHIHRHTYDLVLFHFNPAPLSHIHSSKKSWLFFLCPVFSWQVGTPAVMAAPLTDSPLRDSYQVPHPPGPSLVWPCLSEPVMTPKSGVGWIRIGEPCVCLLV